MEQEENYPSIFHFFVIKVLSLEGVMSTTHLVRPIRIFLV